MAFYSNTNDSPDPIKIFPKFGEKLLSSWLGFMMKATIIWKHSSQVFDASSWILYSDRPRL